MGHKYDEVSEEASKVTYKVKKNKKGLEIIEIEENGEDWEVVKDTLTIVPKGTVSFYTL